MWDSEAFTYPLLTLRTLTLAFCLHFATNVTPAWCLPRLTVFCLFPRLLLLLYFFFSFLCQHNEHLVLRGTPGSNPVVLTGGCNNTTEPSLLTCVLHIDTSAAAVAHDCSWWSLAHYYGQTNFKNALSSASSLIYLLVMYQLWNNGLIMIPGQ